MKYLLFLLMASAFTSVSAQNSDSIVLRQVDSLIQVSRAYTDQRDFKKAIEVNAAAEKLALEILGRESVAYGACCFNLGRVNHYKKDYLEAEKWYLESQAIRERLLGKLHPDYALCLNNLAILYEDQKKLEKAEILYLESKAIREKALGKEHADYIVSLNNLANFYWEQGQYLKAEPYLVEAKDCRAKALGKDHEDYALSLSFLSSLYKAMGHYDKAELYLLESKSICEQIFGKEHPTYAISLNNLGILYALMGIFDKAEQNYLESIEIRKKVLGIEHPGYASSLNNLALLYAELGYYEKAERLHLEAKGIREKVFGKDHLDYGSSLSNLADLYSDIGNYKKAEPLYLEAIEIKVRILGKDDPSYAAILNNLAILYKDMGNYEKAERYYLESIAIREKVLGKDHPYYAVSLNNLAELYWKMNDFQKAEAFYLEAKTIQEEVLGKEHPNYAVTLNNLALIYMHNNNYEKAEIFYLESKSIRENALGKSHPSYATSLINLADVYMLQKDYAKAEQLFLESKSILENVVGKEHPYYSLNLKSLAQLYERTNRTLESEVLLVESTALEQSRLIKASTFLSEEELQKYVSLFQLNSHQIGSYFLTNQQKENAPQKSLLPELMYNDALFYKGFLLQEVNKINGLVQATPESREIQKRLIGFRRRLSVEYSKPLANRTDVSDLEELANQAEKELVRSVTGYNEASRQVSWQDVKSGLKPSEAAIEFVHFQVKFPEKTDTTIYAALLILPGVEQPKFIPLFEEKDLELLVQSNTERKADYVNDLYSLSDRGLVRLGSDRRSLYDLIWKPLEADLSGIKTIYFSPSGLLHRINVDAIPVSEMETIADKYQLIALNSTRQIVIPTTLGNTNNDAVLFGGIQFEQDSTIQNNEPLLASRSRGDLSFASVDSTLRGGNWNYLAGTEREVNAIEKIMQTSGINTSLRKEYEATEESFKKIGANNAPSPRILHIATHGYFFPDPKSTARSTGLSGEQESVFKISDHPMLRSGLILAGGNAAWQGNQTLDGREDGILTAYEISQMNLSNTELVVLSACETGLGEIQGNEGVYGLQRAFKIAGAKYLIMSLWQVPDKQTSLLMTTFYKKWLPSDAEALAGKEEKMTIPAAFHEAQKELRDIGLDPYQWGAFVLME